jgi:hypothetical protein
MKFVPRAARHPAGAVAPAAAKTGPTNAEREPVMGPAAVKSLVQQVAEDAAAFARGSIVDEALSGAFVDDNAVVSASPVVCAEAIEAVTRVTGESCPLPLHLRSGVFLSQNVVAMIRATRFVVVNDQASRRKHIVGSVAAALTNDSVGVLVLVASKDMEFAVGDEITKYRRQSGSGPAPTVMPSHSFASLVSEDPAFIKRYGAFVLLDPCLLRLREFWAAWPQAATVDAKLIVVGDVDQPTLRQLQQISPLFAQAKCTLPAAAARWSSVVHTAVFAPNSMKQLVLLAAMQRTPPPVAVVVNTRAEATEVTALLENAGIPLARESVQVWQASAARRAFGLRHIVNYVLPRTCVASLLTDRVDWYDDLQREGNVCFMTSLVSKDDQAVIGELRDLLLATRQNVPPFLQG